ncbi:MAG: hypothetical protein L6R39_001879 [Caloplaca ligustica]|nr:MAG: hypothetical protein L6R39_001879 [Caloplaca ligustica]
MRIYHPINRLVPRSPPRIFQPVVRYRSITVATATLRISPDVTQKIECTVEGAPDYSVVIQKHVGNALAGRDLGSKSVKKDLIFYDGCYFTSDKNPQTPRLTLTEEVAQLISRFGGAEIPAVLHNCGELAGSGIALKGTEGDEFLKATAIGAELFKKTLRDLE